MSNECEDELLERALLIFCHYIWCLLVIVMSDNVAMASFNRFEVEALQFNVNFTWFFPFALKSALQVGLSIAYLTFCFVIIKLVALF